MRFTALVKALSSKSRLILSFLSTFSTPYDLIALKYKIAYKIKIPILYLIRYIS
jgi:hypothetical protein